MEDNKKAHQEYKEYKEVYGEDSYRYAKLAMTWHGWGSPVGLGLFLISLSLCVYVLHLAGLY